MRYLSGSCVEMLKFFRPGFADTTSEDNTLEKARHQEREVNNPQTLGSAWTIDLQSLNRLFVWRELLRTFLSGLLLFRLRFSFLPECNIQVCFSLLMFSPAVENRPEPTTGIDNGFQI